MSPDFEEIKYDVSDQILTITLNRPDRMNAFTPTMLEELLRAFDMADTDDDIRAVVVTGAGRAFCAGADLEKGGDTFDWRARQQADETPRDGGGQISLRIFNSLKPVIAAINGPAGGGGVKMKPPPDRRGGGSGGKNGLVFTPPRVG